LVLTGKGKYFCAGVDLAGTLKPDHPQKVWNKIKEENQKCFINTFNIVQYFLNFIYSFSCLQYLKLFSIFQNQF
jgi:enoyl-CoA hydratase/carnithine racemase